MDSLISVDLLEAARRSETFPSEWPADKVARALDRYRRFLKLMAKHPGTPLAPTFDIDEMWHLHMLSPRAYYEDCMRLVGHILDHDGGFGRAEEEVPVLQETFARTAALWQAEYGEPFLNPEPEYNVRGGTNAHNCWHDCQNRCWHACKSIQASAQVAASQ